MEIPVKDCIVDMSLFKLHLTGMYVCYQHSWSTRLSLLVNMYTEDINVVLDRKLCRQVG